MCFKTIAQTKCLVSCSDLAERAWRTSQGITCTEWVYLASFLRVKTDESPAPPTFPRLPTQEDVIPGRILECGKKTRQGSFTETSATTTSYERPTAELYSSIWEKSPGNTRGRVYANHVDNMILWIIGRVQCSDSNEQVRRAARLFSSNECFFFLLGPFLNMSQSACILFRIIL